MNTTETRERGNTAWADGSIELFAGLSVLGIGACWLSDQPVFGAVLPALAIPMWRSFHDRFLEPRRGEADVIESDAGANRRGALLLAGLGLCVLALGVLVHRGLVARDVDLARHLVAGLPAALLGVMAVAASLGYRSLGLALYAPACVLAGALVVQFDLHPGHGLWVSGVSPTLVGAAKLARFGRSHPRRPGRLA
jgi:hypothetical protein